MKFAFSLSLLSLVLASPALADPIHGKWRTAADDNGNSGLIEIAPCGSDICGTLVQSFDSSGASVSSDQIGTKIITATVNKGEGLYKGKIYAPDRDKTYSSKLQLSDDSLAVSGCVFGICRDGGTWTRQ